jgi:RimJ/RimL family protein N-acetyltransferase
VTEIVTERLCLRPFEAADLPAFVAYRSTPGVAHYQSWDTTYSQADAERFLAEQQAAELGQPGEWVQLAAIDRATGELCGDCAVRIEGDRPASAEIGVTLAPEHQGRGLAGEALGAVIAALFERFGIERIHAETDERNAAVHRLLERLGLRCERRIPDAEWFKGEWVSLHIYAITSEQWGREPHSRA